MVQTGVIQYLHRRMDGAGLRVIGAIDQALEPGVNQSAGTHRARLNCNKQLAALQAMVSESCTGLEQGDDLGVGGGIGVANVAVAAPANYFSGTHYHCADGNFSGFQRALSLAERFFHEKFVGACIICRSRRIGRRSVQGTYSI
jgi:hypothetical protein